MYKKGQAKQRVREVLDKESRGKKGGVRASVPRAWWVGDRKLLRRRPSAECASRQVIM